jgi:hypothetical protein
VTHSFLLFVIYALCIHRLTRLGNKDTITEPIREWLKGKSFGELVERDNFTGNVISRTPAPKPKSIWSMLWTLSECPWCLGWWWSVIITTVAYFNGSWFQYVCVPFAFSSITGLLAQIEKD